MEVVKCPLCGEKIKFENKPFIGQRRSCPGCDAELEVVDLKPLSLDWPYDDDYLSFDDSGYIEEDEEYEYEDYEEY